MTTDLSSQVQMHAFPDPAALATALAQAVAANLRTALEARTGASLALSGGNTPKAFMRALSSQSLDWSRVSITLVDERWVAEDNTRSNAALLREHLLRGPAAAARFLPLYRDVATPDDALDELERDLATLPSPFDAIVLGMGNDGHTASFFPGGDRLAQALDPDSSQRVLPMRAPGAGEPRITLTLPPLLAARHLYLHIEGTQKRAVLTEAVSGTGEGARYPIRSVLRHTRSPLATYWCA
jgi:6-phosphogluconolactonase